MTQKNKRQYYAFVKLLLEWLRCFFHQRRNTIFLESQKILSKGYFLAGVFNLDIRFGISWSQALMKNKILALYCRRESRAIVDFLGNKTFQGILILKKSDDVVSMETVKCSRASLIESANNDCVHRLHS
jgi:hypothetical protein